MITGGDVTLSICVIDGVGTHITFQAAELQQSVRRKGFASNLGFIG